MKTKTVNRKPCRMEPDAVIRSLRLAFSVPRDYTQSLIRLRNTINRLPKEDLQIAHQRGNVYFYVRGKYLPKQSDLLYSLARKRYCQLLYDLVSLADSCSDREWASTFEKLERLIRDFARGRLQLERILLTRRQYHWLFSCYKKKYFSPDQCRQNLTIPQGDSVRSKSEQNIGNKLHVFAVPCHYEEELLINVQKLVISLEEELRQRNLLQDNLFYYQGYTCVWNVPAELSWMNAPSSIWRSYDDRTGCLRLHPDYTVILADESLLYWEHEGLMHQFFYRTNALERIEVMCQAGGIAKARIIETDEQQANDQNALEEVIRTRILPWLWF